MFICEKKVGILNPNLCDILTKIATLLLGGVSFAGTYVKREKVEKVYRDIRLRGGYLPPSEASIKHIFIRSFPLT